MKSGTETDNLQRLTPKFKHIMMATRAGSSHASVARRLHRYVPIQDAALRHVASLLQHFAFNSTFPLKPQSVV